MAAVFPLGYARMGLWVSVISIRALWLLASPSDLAPLAEDHLEEELDVHHVDRDSGGLRARFSGLSG